MISKDRMEKALTYLAEHDEEAALLLSEMERYEFKAKAVKDAVFLHNPDNLKTVAEREACAGCCEEYRNAMDDYLTAVKDFNAVKNKRQTESLIVDVWRSLNSSRNKGNL